MALKLAFVTQALGDIQEGDNRAFDLSCVTDRVRPVFHGNGVAILVPEHLVVHMNNLVAQMGFVDTAFMYWIGGAIRMAVMEQFMGMLAKQLFFPFVAQHVQAGGVGEGNASFHVYPIDGLGSRFQEQARLPFAALHQRLAPEFVLVVSGQELCALLSPPQPGAHPRSADEGKRQDCHNPGSSVDRSVKLRLVYFSYQEPGRIWNCTHCADHRNPTIVFTFYQATYTLFHHAGYYFLFACREPQLQRRVVAVTQVA